MTEVDNMPSTGVRWESGQIEDDFEGGNNSAKLFERSRIKALAGKFQKKKIDFLALRKYCVIDGPC